MAQIYKENTEYVNPLKSGIPPAKKYANISQTMKQKAPIFNLADAGKEPVGLTEEERAYMVNPQTNFKVGGAIVPFTDEQKAGPEGLSSFLQRVQPTEPNGIYNFRQPGTIGISKVYALPSDSAVVKTIPTGGEYISDPTQPNKIVATERNWSFDENQLIRNGLNPAFYEIDHIVPLWAGGTNTTTNREILRKDEHELKTKVQAIPYTLVANGIISPDEAFSMATNWRGKSVGNIPNLDQYGMVPVDIALSQYNKWNSGDDLSNDGEGAWNGFINVIKQPFQKIYQGTSNFYHNVLLGGGEESDSLALTKEFGKHLVASIPFADVLVPQLAEVGNMKEKECRHQQIYQPSLAGLLVI